MAVEIIPVGNRIMCTATALMKIPDAGSANVRQVEFRLPLFQQRPVVNATVYSTPGQSQGVPFAIWDVNVQSLGSQTQIVISATNVEPGVPVEFDYYCDVIVVGEAA